MNSNYIRLHDVTSSRMVQYNLAIDRLQSYVQWAITLPFGNTADNGPLPTAMPVGNITAQTLPQKGTAAVLMNFGQLFSIICECDVHFMF